MYNKTIGGDGKNETMQEWTPQTHPIEGKRSILRKKGCPKVGGMRKVIKKKRAKSAWSDGGGKKGGWGSACTEIPKNQTQKGVVKKSRPHGRQRSSFF